jgi:hypothetical protein
MVLSHLRASKIPEIFLISGKISPPTLDTPAKIRHQVQSRLGLQPLVPFQDFTNQHGPGSLGAFGFSLEPVQQPIRQLYCEGLQCLQDNTTLSDLQHRARTHPADKRRARGLTSCPPNLSPPLPFSVLKLT